MKKIMAKNYIEAYDYRAKYFKDSFMMSGRDKKRTIVKNKRVVELLDFSKNNKVLDIGCGDGTFFKLMHKKVKKCYGIDPSKVGISKLKNNYKKYKNIEFKVGFSSKIPYPKDYLDIIVVNSVMHILPGKKEIVETLKEIKRVAKRGAVIYIGEIPFKDEGWDPGIIKRSIKFIKDFGIFAFVGAAYNQYILQIIKGRPLLIEPVEKMLYFSGKYFLDMCKKEGFDGRYFRHKEINDFLLRKK